jgi:hypothetical protein
MWRERSCQIVAPGILLSIRNKCSINQHVDTWYSPQRRSIERGDSHEGETGKNGGAWARKTKDGENSMVRVFPSMFKYEGEEIEKVNARRPHGYKHDT